MKLIPSFTSLYSRIFLVMIIVIVLAFVASNSLWVANMEAQKQQRAVNMAKDLAHNMASTVVFFRNFPKEYRPNILELLRNMGGARFFVSVNDDPIDVTPFEPSPLKQQSIEAFTDTIRSRLGATFGDLKVSFANPEELRVFNDNTLLVDLPDRWAQNVIILRPDPAPVFVAQFEVAGGEWLYLAGLYPEPYIFEEHEALPSAQLQFLVVLSLLLIAVAWLLVRWLTTPLSRLSKAAHSLGSELHLVPIEVVGPKEVKQTARAFNRMQERLLRFIDDRERLFSAISHDLKTPITRLRLRAELLEPSEYKEGIAHDLDDLENLVRAALDFSEDVTLAEANEPLDLMQLLNVLKQDMAILGHPLPITGPSRLDYVGKPKALRRALGNLVENAFFYADQAWLTVSQEEDHIVICLQDDGPGIPQGQFDYVFEPFTRLEGSRNKHTGGNGLGMSIARNIIHAHGGQVQLQQAPQGGLEIQISLPLSEM